MSEASVVFRLRDQYSQTANNMANANRGFNKSLEETQRQAQQYSQRLSSLVRDQARLQTSLEGAKRELSEAKKAFRETGSAADSDALTSAYENYNRLKAALSDTTRAAKDTQRALADLNETNRKQMDADVRQGASGSTESSSLLSRLGSAGATAMLGSTLSQVVGAYATSALGSAGGNYVTSALSSAGMGAAIGSAIAPGIGTAVGAALGGLVGLFTAKVDELNERDDAYRDTVQETYNSLQERQSQSLQSGSAIAAGRQTTRASFATLLGGEPAADRLLSGVRDFSNMTPYFYDDLAKISRQLLAYDYDAGEILDMLAKTGNAASAVGGGTAGMSTIAEVLGRMNMGTIENDQLKRLIDLGINPYEMLAGKSNEMAAAGARMIASGRYSDQEIENIRSMMEYVQENGPYTAQVIKEMVSDGLIPAKMAAEALADAMGETYAGSLEAQSRTYEGLASTLQGLQDEMSAAMGQGYNERRMTGMQDQIAWLQGETSAGMQEAYRLMGEFQADLENQQEQLQRDAINSVMSGVLSGSWSEEHAAQLSELMSQYDAAKAQDNGAEMGRVIAAAQAVAQSEYTLSEGYQTQISAQKDLVSNVQAAVSDSYYDAGYDLGQQLSLGVEAAINARKGDIENAASLQNMRMIASVSPADARAIDPRMFAGGNSHAYGLERVPYDNYPALLHEGERVLTAAEARQQSAGPTVTIAKLADEIVVREDADIDRIARALADQLQAAMMTGVA